MNLTLTVTHQSSGDSRLRFTQKHEHANSDSTHFYVAHSAMWVFTLNLGVNGTAVSIVMGSTHRCGEEKALEQTERNGDMQGGIIISEL